MKKLLILLLTNAPLVAMSLEKTRPTKPTVVALKTKAANPFEKNEIEALRALGRLDIPTLKKCLDSDNFDINGLLPAQEVYDIRGVWAQRTLLETALCLQVQNFNDKQFEAYEQCLKLILLHKKLDANKLDYNRWSPLHLAVFNDDPLALQLLLAMKTKLRLNLNIRGFDGQTPLFLAASQNPLALCDLLKHGADYTIPDEKGRPVVYALIEQKALDGNLYALIALAEHGVPIDAPFLGKTAFELALEQVTGAGSHNKKAPSILNLAALLALGARCNRANIAAMIGLGTSADDEDYSFAETALVHAFNGTAFEDKEIKKIARKQKAGLNLALDQADNIYCMTPLMWAAARGNMKLAQQIVALGASLYYRDNFSNTALHHAVRNGHIAMARYLKEIAPLAYILRNNFDRTPVDVAISSKQSREMLLMLAQ